VESDAEAAAEDAPGDAVEEEEGESEDAEES
jgi:hypothetical protein